MNDLDKFSDPDKANFVRHLVIPEALKILKQVLSVKSNQVIPQFSPFNKCDDVRGKKPPNISIRSNYHETRPQADFLLYYGVINDPAKGLAYANSCILGNSL